MQLSPGRRPLPRRVFFAIARVPVWLDEEIQKRRAVCSIDCRDGQPVPGRVKQSTITGQQVKAGKTWQPMPCSRRRYNDGRFSLPVCADAWQLSGVWIAATGSRYPAGWKRSAFVCLRVQPMPCSCRRDNVGPRRASLVVSSLYGLMRKYGDGGDAVQFGR